MVGPARQAFAAVSLSPRLLVVAGVLAAVAGVGIGFAFHAALQPGRTRPAPALPELYGQMVWGAGRRPAPPFALKDQNGALVSLAGQHGRTVLVAFMDPRCMHACQIEGTGLALAERQVEPSQRPALLIVSVDPRARAAASRAAALRWGISGDWHWLLGRRSQLAPVWRAYGVEPSVSGSSVVYLIDQSGFERAGVHAPFLPQFMADDLRALAAESS